MESPMPTAKNRIRTGGSVALRSWLVFGISGTFALGLLGLGFAGESLLGQYYENFGNTALTGSDVEPTDLGDPISDENSADSEYEVGQSPEEPAVTDSTPETNSNVDNSQNDSNTGGDGYTVEDVVLSEAVYTESDYVYYPVNKKYAFPSGYSPSGLVSLANYDVARVGGKTLYLRGNVAVALEDMVSEMGGEGYSVAVRSAYRSESTQVSTFNSWVQKEMAEGYSYNESVARASEYSARPRHSEHQLGTTIDLTLPRLDNAFTQTMWSTPEVAWLMQNAHRYGFVFSYPQNRQLITGYTAEPWHLRYIGITFATELYTQGYLNSNSSLCVFAYLFNR